jgi:hypothetical protein
MTEFLNHPPEEILRTDFVNREFGKLGYPSSRRTAAYEGALDLVALLMAAHGASSPLTPEVCSWLDTFG